MLFIGRMSFVSANHTKALMDTWNTATLTPTRKNHSFVSFCIHPLMDKRLLPLYACSLVAVPYKISVYLFPRYFIAVHCFTFVYECDLCFLTLYIFGSLSLLLFLGPMFCGVRTAPYWKYMWNEYLLKNCYTELHHDWLLYIVHGFIGQSSIFSAYSFCSVVLFCCCVMIVTP